MEGPRRTTPRRDPGHAAPVSGLGGRHGGRRLLRLVRRPARGVRCAVAIAKAVKALGLEVRAGLHTGEVETIDSKIVGMAVNIGARVGGLAGASEVLVSNTVKDLVVGSDLTFEDASEHELKGVPRPLAALSGGQRITVRWRPRWRPNRCAGQMRF
jgi:class 3 adenylate cyclase